MALKKIYIGSFGPALYDDTDDISDVDGDFSGKTQQALTTDGAADIEGDLSVGGDLVVTGDADVTGAITVGSLKLDDTAADNTLQLKWNEDGAADYVLNLLVGGGTRSLTLNENFIIGDGSAGTLTFTQASKVLSVYDSCTLPHLDGKTLQIDGVNSDGGAFSFTTSGIVSFNQIIRGATSLWYDAIHISAFSCAPGVSGASCIPPDGNTLGGYRLSAAAHTLYLNESITSTWDGASDISFRVTFEVNVDNTGGADGDTVDLKLVCYYKGDGETVNKTQTLTTPTKTVGKSPRYKRFTTVFTIDWNAGDNEVEVADKISFLLNCEASGDVTDVIVNTIMFRYPTAKMNVEV